MTKTIKETPAKKIKEKVTKVKKEKVPSEKKTKIEKPIQVQKVIKSTQPEVNIGMIGHVDHGKCIAADEMILLNNSLSDGNELINRTQNNTPTFLSNSEKTYDLHNLRAFSLDPIFNTTSVKSNLFVQNYNGIMYKITTKRGKEIVTSPKHPLLVHNGNEIIWKESKKLNTGDYIAAIKTLHSNEYIKDPTPEWKTELEKECWIIDKEQFTKLKMKTQNFTHFSNLNNEELNQIRVLTINSCGKIKKMMNFYPGEISKGLKTKLTKRQKNKLFDLFTRAEIKEPKNLILNYKKKTQNFCEINYNDFWDNRIIKFIALIISEGYLTPTSTHFSQSNNTLLKEFKKISKELFNLIPNKNSDVDYQISNKALSLFLQTKYGLKIGNSRQAGIPKWIFTLPKDKLAIFLNIFYSAEGNFNLPSKQISLSQANKQSIIIISYCLKQFGITHSIHPIKKVATNSPNKEKKTYWQILISSKQNFVKFKKEIGISLKYKQTNLLKLTHTPISGKQTDEMIPLDSNLFSELINHLGLKKKKFSVKTKPLKRQEWFFAYQDCKRKNSISSNKYLFLEKKIKQRLTELKQLTNKINQNNIKEIMSETGISQQDIGNALNVSQKKIHTLINKKETLIVKEIKNQINNKINNANNLFKQIQFNSPKNIEWDKIREIKQLQYKGPIIDLQVPGYHNFIAGMGGIISHNTSLTKALTGTWTDTHSEELKRGISIRLGYADAHFYKLKTPSGEIYSTNPKDGEIIKERIVSFVDAPGHETLMTTMLSGAALMRGAVLVVAANEKCPQPRTIEHLMALKFAGVKNIVVAQNKIDLVEKDKLLENYKKIQGFLKEYGYDDSPIIPTSANFGANIDLLIGAIETHITTPKYDLDKPLKMFIARSFDVNKPGTDITKMKGAILGGSISQGCVKIGDELELVPALKDKTIVKVKSISTNMGPVQEAHPGGLLAIGTDLDPSIAQNDQLRGKILAKVGSLPAPKKQIKVRVQMFERMVDFNPKDFEIKVNEPLVLTLGTNTGVGFVSSVKKDEIDVNLKNEEAIEVGEKIAISKNINNQWRLVAYGEII
jgi:translation initiation factor 2 subunit 3